MVTPLRRLARMLSSDLAAVACSGVGLYCAYRVLSRLFTAPDGVDPREMACRTTSAIHAALVGPAVVLRVVGAVQPWVGPLSMSVSMGYFIQDAIVILEMGTEQHAAPILAHHALCIGSIVTMLTAGRHQTWYANLLQWTECTIPIQFICWLLEIYGIDKTRPRTYACGRWLMGIAWVTMRLALMLGFWHVVWRDWSTFDAIPRAACMVLGPFLTAFNVGGLFKVVLPGMPWWPPKMDSKKR
eukprot:1433824-Prymnesium_polylepis.1